MKKFVQKWALPLRWWICFTLINIATVILFLTGFVDKILEVDFSKLSFVIYIIFYVFSVRNGVLVYTFSKKCMPVQSDIDTCYDKNEVGWFAADCLLTLGIIGTVIGFIFMLSGFEGVSDTTNVLTMKTAILKMSLGMSTALYTTLAGLVSSLLLKLQLFDFEQCLKRFSSE